ncbi:MAG: hypothetical protein JO159_14380, partial [Acidobacteria bacterium]|nr:hypothetical protein [Acidobacteriota bacterium]
RAVHHIAALRYLPNGVLDARFGQDGIAELGMEATARGAALDSQGRIVIVGTALSSMESLIARFDSNGKVDRSFGTSGTVSLHDDDVSQVLEATALQQDGKIVAVGVRRWHSATRVPEPGKRDQIAVVRPESNGALDKAFAGEVCSASLLLDISGALAQSPFSRMRNS